MATVLSVGTSPTASFSNPLYNTFNDATKAGQRMGSGDSIISAGDNIPNFIVGTRLQSDSTILDKVTEILKEGGSAISIAATGLTSIKELFDSMRVLITQATGGISGEASNKLLNAEFQESLKSYQRIVDTTNFNGIKLLNGDISATSNLMTDDRGAIRGDGISSLVYNPGLDTGPAPTSMINLNGVYAIASSTVSGSNCTATNLNTFQDVTLSLKSASVSAAKAAYFRISNAGNNGVNGTASVTFNLVTTATANTATAVNINIGTGMTGAEIAKAMVDAINDPSGAQAAALANNGFTATIDPNNNTKVFITRNSIGVATTDISYDIVNSATTTDIFNGIQYGQTAASLAAAATSKVPSSTQTNAALIIPGASVTAFVTALNNAINTTSGITVTGTLDGYLTSVLSSMSATTSKTNSGSTAADTITIKSNYQGVAGQISLVAGTRSYLSTYDATKSEVGSLGVSSSSISGNTIGNGAGYIKWNNNSVSVASSGFVNVPLSSLSEGAVFQITNSANAPQYTFKEVPTNDADVKLSGTKDPITGVLQVDVQQTIVNLVNKLRKTQDPFIKNFEYEVQKNLTGTAMKISSRTADTSLNGIKASISLSNTALTTWTLGGADDGGINVANIQNNKLFLGNISTKNVEANYAGNNKVAMTITSPRKGDTPIYYTATFDPNPTTETVVRFTSTIKDGGYFDVTLAAGTGMAVSNQSLAETYSANFATALSGLTLMQTRDVLSFQPSTNDSLLTNTFVQYTSNNFDNAIEVSSVTVQGTNDDLTLSNKSYITITLSDGSIYKNSLNTTEVLEFLKAGSKLDLYLNGDNAQKNKFSIFFGNSINMSDNNTVAALRSQLKSAFKAGQSAMTFQADTSAMERIAFSVQSMTYQSIFGDASMDISTSEGALAASTLVEKAMDIILAASSKVGSAQKIIEQITNTVVSKQLRYQEASDIFLKYPMDKAVSELNMKQAQAINFIAAMVKMSNLRTQIQQQLQQM